MAFDNDVSTRSIGRLHVFEVRAERATAAADPVPEDMTLERRELAGGSIGVRLLDGSGDLMGTYRVSGDHHDDTFYGRYSAPHPDFCYGSQLEVFPAARGRGLGQTMVRIGRLIADDTWGRGLRGMIAEGNTASFRCNESAGLQLHEEAFGIRLGARTLWLRRRRVGE